MRQNNAEPLFGMGYTAGRWLLFSLRAEWMFPAARITDNHVCPMVTGVVPHVGGPILKGEVTVLIGMMPAARVTDTAVCTGPPDMVAKGSATVLIGCMPASRLTDSMAHGGLIVAPGAPTVIIGG